MSPDTGHALCHSPEVHRHPRYQQWLHPSEKETHAQSSNSHLVHVEAGPKPRQPGLEDLLTQGGEGLGFHTQSTASAQHLGTQSFICRLHSDGSSHVGHVPKIHPWHFTVKYPVEIFF